MSTATAPASPAAAGCEPVETSPAAHTMGVDAATRVASALRALADPLRLRMLSLIATSPTGEACVCDIATVADVSQPTVSHHLKVLRDAGILTSERRGTWVYYRVAAQFRAAVPALLEGFAPATLDAPGETIGLTDVDEMLTRLAAGLAGDTPDLPAEAVLRTVRESYTALARRSSVRSHLVVTTERFARQRLADLVAIGADARAGARAGTAEQAGSAVDARPRVLFVCVANAGRSQLAAALLHHYAGDAVVVRSAGSAPAGDVHDGVRPLLDALGEREAYPKPLTDDAVRAADVVVTMGCGDTCPVLPGTRYEDWVVGDPALASSAGVAAIRDELDRRVRALLGDLLPDLDLTTSPASGTSPLQEQS